jgi:hypothetical protein
MGSSRFNGFAVRAGSIDTEGAFTTWTLNATAEIPNLKSEKFSFRLQRLATSSGQLRTRQTMLQSLSMRLTILIYEDRRDR